MDASNDKSPPRIALIGSYVPRRCGIATFTHDLATAISQHVYDRPLEKGELVTIVAVNDRDGEYPYAPQVTFEIAQHRKEDYRNAAEVLNNSWVDAVCLQHEYGIFGGEDGDYVLELADRLQKPLVTTIHTVLREPTKGQRRVLEQICERSNLVVVMSQRACLWLRERYSVPPEKIRMIHHGAPDVSLGSTEPFKERFGVERRPTVLTFGLLSPGKGIETMLDALSQVVPDFPEVAYIVLGVTHPMVRKDAGESYRLSLESRAASLGIQKNVIFHNRYVSLADLCDYLQATDIYVTPYISKEQITSGTLAYAVACGCAIVSTPYWYAEELLADGRGRLIEFGDADGLAAQLTELLADSDERRRLRTRTYEFGRSMIWSEVGREYVEASREAIRTHVKGNKGQAGDRELLLRMSLPRARLDHFFNMTDDTGMLQHAIYSTPNRLHGYCTDDNARALIVTSMKWSLFRDEEVLRYQQTYLSFLHYAWSAKLGRFKNFLGYDRRWLDEGGGDDCCGRALWALGHLVAHAPHPSVQRLAYRLFQDATPRARSLRHPRGQAFAVLGLYYFTRGQSVNGDVRPILRHLADELSQAFRQNATEEWPWLDRLVTYENARLPQALIAAGYRLHDDELVRQGLRILRWLLDVQTTPGSHLSIIGNSGWFARGGERARFDQQPVEVAALIGACKAAYRASEDPTWLVEMRRCFEWFLGRNDVGMPLVDFKTRGCHDGLTTNGVNENEGAESLLSWLLSLLTMHEIQTDLTPFSAHS